jgi:hypothetical protein
MPKPIEAGSIPDLELVDLSGETRSLREMTKERHVVLELLRGLW